MKIETRKRMWKSSLAVLFVFASVVAFLIFAAIKARGIPFALDWRAEPSSNVPPVAVTYFTAQCADFLIKGSLKKVCTQPGSELPGDEQDKKAFEEYFNIMVFFAGEEDVPFISLLTIENSEASPKIFVGLSNGYGDYASGEGDTFTAAIDNLVTAFFFGKHTEKGKGGFSVETHNKQFEV